MWKIRIRIRDEQSESYFRELRNNFFGLKYFDADPEWEKFGYMMEKFVSGINIPDPQHCEINHLCQASNAAQAIQPSEIQCKKKKTIRFLDSLIVVCFA